MPVNLYGNIGTTYTGIVTGAELERVSQEIFGGAKVQAPAQPAQNIQAESSPKTQSADPSQINLYNRNTNIALTQQVAQTRIDYNVQLTPQAMQNIEALKVLAATQQQNVHKLSEGKIYVPVDNSQKSDVETAFALPHPTSVFNSFSLEKDRKGSSPFTYTQMPSQSQEESAEGNSAINIVA